MKTSYFKLLILIYGFTYFSSIKAATVDLLHKQGVEIVKAEESIAFYEEGMSFYKSFEYLPAEKAFLKVIDLARKTNNPSDLLPRFWAFLTGVS